MDPITGLAHLRAALADQREVLATGDLDAPVPGCPGWTLRDLAFHVGGNHRWASGAIAEGHPNTEVLPAPHPREGLLAWYDEGAGALLDLLARTDPQAPCWSFGPKPSLARFWFRRLAHEHTVHAVDALAVLGATRPVDAALALDGVDEVAAIFFPRQVRLRRIQPLTRSLAVRPDEADGAAWLLARDGLGAGGPGEGGPGEGSAVSGAADATVAGPAEALYLLLWRRVGLDDERLVVDGDRAAAEAVLGTAIVP